jgi:hypothetical protein
MTALPCLLDVVALSLLGFAGSKKRAVKAVLIISLTHSLTYLLGFCCCLESKKDKQ